MAEIKSTLEMVMERAARMTAEVAEESGNENAERRGMRAAAALLNGEPTDLLAVLKEQPANEQPYISRKQYGKLLN